MADSTDNSPDFEMIDPPCDMQTIEASDVDGAAEVINAPRSSRAGKSTSDVWAFMTHNIQAKQAKCDKCLKVYKLGSNGRNGTGMLLRHVRKCYGVDANFQPVVPSTSVLSHFVPIAPSQRGKVFDRILEWIIADQQALSVVAHPAFKAIFQELPGKYQPPTPPMFRKKAFLNFEAEKKRIKALILTAPGNIALTCDGWSSSVHQHYLAITAHWVDREWKLQRMILDFVEFPLPRTASAAKELVKAAMYDFGINEKVHAMVTDNTPSAYNISKLMALDSEDYFFEQRCGAHIINLIIKHALEDNDGCPEMAPMRALAVALHRTDSLRTILRGECDRLGVQYHLPPLPCDTRWGSTLNLLEGLIKIETALVMVFRSNSEFLDHAWGDETWARIRDLISLLQPFNDLSKVIQGQDFPTIGLLGLGYDFIASRLRQLAIAPDTSVWLQDKAALFATKTLRYTADWFSNGTATHWAVLMDPSVKDSLLVRDGGLEASQALKTSLLEHLETYYSVGASTSVEGPRNDFLSALQDFVGTSSGLTAQQEIEAYLKESRVRAGTTSALEYWKLAEE